MSELLQLLKDAYVRKASDVHFRSNERTWIRIDGQLTPASPQVYSTQMLNEMFMPVIPDIKKEYFDQGREIDFAWELEGVARFRINIYKDINGLGGCFRILPSEIKNANDLNLEAAILELCTRTKGLILVTGPTGSGKTTTLSALIDYINLLRTDHIITIEDPIEFVHKEKNCLINQRETGAHTKGFSEALRAALREDPDVVMVGEMRDLETTATALEVAETGHLVLSTLHTNNASDTVYRVINQFPKKKQDQIRVSLASSLIGVISQVLIPKASGEGRIAVREIMIMNHAISNLIRENKIYQIN
ncbi:MAG: PilT/PilU family type 4a pilus ATPase, partial [Candidatus Aureabacteria bacterium]|nr:PilT/PilU family type 4a pilus ATPase [Candidatus Auribacterota bacterium]